MVLHDGRGGDPDMAHVGSTLRVMQMDGLSRFRAAWRYGSLAAFFVAWFLVIWWTEGALSDWIRAPLTVLWLLAVIGAVGMTVEALIAGRRGRNTDSSS
ncbi:hypothetical protein ACFQ8E_15060 [Isoptericola sp. NPDC056573]|uniref:hypothetical protein n=1 Tax=Isoptericola sp. NPDC056573 TaxID=3345868 RepID=UPI0036CE448F